MALQSSKTSISLPGGVKTRISGIGVFYPDRTPTQRVGVKIDVKVYLTLKISLKDGMNCWRKQ